MPQGYGTGPTVLFIYFKDFDKSLAGIKSNNFVYDTVSYMGSNPFNDH